MEGLEQQCWSTLLKIEWAVCDLVAAGRSNQEISTELGYSLKYVENILANLYSKLEIPVTLTGYGKRVTLAVGYVRESQ